MADKYKRNLDTILGLGTQGVVTLQNGIAVKELHNNLVDETKLQEIRSRLLLYDIPTYDYFEVDRVNHIQKTTDLSNGGRNLVVSLPDQIQMTPDEWSFWQKSVSQRLDTINIAEFLDTNRNTLEKLVNSNTLAIYSAFTLVAEPGGNCKMLICDYDDGVFLNDIGEKLSSNDTAKMLSNYFEFLTKIVVGFFPQTSSDIKNEISEIAKKYTISPSRIPD